MNTFKHSKKDIEDAALLVKSKASLIRYFNLKPNGGTYRQFTKYISVYNIDTSHFTGELWSKGETKLTNKTLEAQSIKRSYTDAEILKKDSPCTKSQRLKQLMIKYDKKYECSNKTCSVTDTWNGSKITLDVDHINGDNMDNRLENLRFLCPNCHRQTPTWGKRKQINK